MPKIGIQALEHALQSLNALYIALYILQGSGSDDPATGPTRR